MLIWINGPFGGGKTQSAYELARRVVGSVVCDPEEVGFGLHRMTPRGLRGDFQDFVAWRAGVVEVLDFVLGRHDGVVIAPMTVVEPEYFAETVGRLRGRGHDVRHFSLLASEETVRRRLWERGFGHLVGVVAGRGAPLRRESFALAKLPLCLERLREPVFAEQVWTDDLPVSGVVEHIARRCGLSLVPDTDGPLRRRVRRAWTGVRHIRF